MTRRWVEVITLCLCGVGIANAGPLPDPGCKATPDELAQTRRLGVEFFRPGITADERIALISPGYIQHNVRFKKYGEAHGLNDHDAFVAMLRSSQVGVQPVRPAGEPSPPPGDLYALVIVQCNFVVVTHKSYRHDPGDSPEAWSEVFTSDIFRVEAGKLAEHWDSPAAGH